ncbi:MAG: SUKH-3 domain-containing protein [Oscillospiraceae bacterium]|nr:SUKH-3 domain-containing protein [Oscillospiraceae bacterium]
MDLSKLTVRAKALIDSCGYGRERIMSEDSLDECFAFFEEEGYRVFPEAREIIENFYMISIGKRGQFRGERFEITENSDIENKMVVYPENIYDAAALFGQLSKAVNDYVIPLGLMGEDYIAIGESGKIYIISEEVYIGGENWTDFLNNFAENFKGTDSLKEIK